MWSSKNKVTRRKDCNVRNTIQRILFVPVIVISCVKAAIKKTHLLCILNISRCYSAYMIFCLLTPFVEMSKYAYKTHFISSTSVTVPASNSNLHHHTLRKELYSTGWFLLGEVRRNRTCPKSPQEEKEWQTSWQSKYGLSRQHSKRQCVHSLLYYYY